MQNERRSKKRKGNGWKLLFGLGLAGLLVAGVALIPSVASAEEEAAAHDHAAQAAGLQDELAQVRWSRPGSIGSKRRSRPATSSAG